MVESISYPIFHCKMKYIWQRRDGNSVWQRKYEIFSVDVDFTSQDMVTVFQLYLWWPSLWLFYWILWNFLDGVFFPKHLWTTATAVSFEMYQKGLLHRTAFRLKQKLKSRLGYSNPHTKFLKKWEKVRNLPIHIVLLRKKLSIK